MGDISWQRDREVVLDRFVAACSADDRIVAAFLAGSAARGEADEHSDLDLSVVVPDDDLDEVVEDRERLIAQLGDALFLEDFGIGGLVFAILSDGTDIELHFVRESELDRVRSGPHRVLVDDRGVLAGVTFPWPEFDRATQTQELRDVVMWFWHDLSHFVTAIERDHLWWAAGQLEALRAYCVRLARIEHGAEPMPDEPYWKLDAEMATAPLEPISSAFVPIERAAMLDAARTLLAFFRSRAPAIAAAHGLTYPERLDRLAGARLTTSTLREPPPTLERRRSGGSMQVRTATHLDVETMCDIFFASYNDLHRRHGLAEENPQDRDWLADAIRHVLHTDPSGTVLATDGGTPTAFATSYLRDSYWFLSFLFVRPDAQGRGVGKALLDAVMPPENDGLTRALVVESFQPVSTGLYAGHGITPRGVRYVLTDLTDPARLPESGAGIEVAAVTTEAVVEMSELDRRQIGFARPADHEWWLRSEMKAHAYRHHGVLVGYAYVDDEGVVGPALGKDEATTCAIVTDLIRRAEHPEALKVPVYGNNAGLFRMLVRAGARIEPSDFRYFYCSTDDALPATYIHYAGYMA